MRNEHDREESREIEVFLPRSVELLAPEREQPEEYRPRQPQIRSRKRLAIILFLATCASTFFAGLWISGGSFLGGLTYSGAVMAILLSHEMGHYLQARRYHVPASYPYFIPMPLTPIGTMGAVIIQGSGTADRKQMFDIAISGPLAGLVIALPVMYFGVVNAKIVEIPPGQRGLAFGDPLILKWTVETVHRPMKENEDVLLTPLLFAGWVGIFITALNLIPIGQLDGGHILYTLIGKRSHYVAILLLLGAVVFMIVMQYYAYILMVLLLFLMGPRHPPTRDDSVPLGAFRVILGWLTLAFIIIGFTPTPIVNTP